MLTKKIGIDCDLGSFLKQEIGTIIDDIDIDPIELIEPKSEVFTQQFLKDSKGHLVQNEPVHDIMHRFIRISRSNGYNKHMILGSFGHGKSLILHTKVMMFDCSFKYVEDIKVGDLLMGPDSKPRKVLALGRGKEQSYKVTLKNKDSFKCNASHKMPFVISNKWKGYKKGDVVVLTLKEILTFKENIRKNCFKIQKATLDFKSQDVPMDAYVYGAWLGDGKKGCLQITINDKDTVISDYFINWGKKYKYHFALYEERGKCSTYSLTVNHKKFSKVFYDKYHAPLLKLHNNEKRIDKRYLINDRKIRLNLLAGMLDTDGYCFDKCFEWSTKYIGLRDDTLFLCRSLGLSVSHRIKKVNGVDYYVVIISGNTHEIPCKTRKKAGKREQIKNPLVYGFDIEDIGEQEYCGIVLDNDHLYLQDDFTIHHNTETIGMGFVLHEIAKNPNILVKIVHLSDDEASKRCRAIRDYIGNDEDVKRIAPHLQPTAIWGSQRFTVKRDTMSLNSTVEAYGVLSTAIGGRANLILFDDIMDLRSAVLEPTTRKKIEETFKNVWLTRLIPGDSEAIVLINKWHANDISAVIQQNPTWAWMSIAVAESLDHLLYEDSFGKKYKLPTWSKFTKKDFEVKIHDMGQRDFDRGYRLIAYSDADKTFPSFKECCRFGIGPEAIIENEANWIFVGGIDFAGLKRPGTVLSIVAAHRKSGLKLPVYIRTLRGTNELPEEMVKTWRQFGVDHFVAENNGLQDTIIELLESTLGSEKYKRFGIRIESFLTSRNKADPIQGLPSINKEFEKGEWLFPLKAEPVMGDCDINDPWVKMYFEFLNHPFYETSDIVMSLWFCREGIKTFYRNDSGPNVY